MLTIETATLESNELSEELDDASLQAITGGFAAGISTSASLATVLSLFGTPVLALAASAAFSGAVSTTL